MYTCLYAMSMYVDVYTYTHDVHVYTEYRLQSGMLYICSLQGEMLIRPRNQTCVHGSDLIQHYVHVRTCI